MKPIVQSGSGRVVWASSEHPRCFTCRFWEPEDPHDVETEVGICCRHAPFGRINQPAEEDRRTSPWCWPETAAGDWCGEWNGTPWPPRGGGE